MIRQIDKGRAERATGAADEIIRVEREERAEKTARLREARLARETQYRTKTDAKKRGHK